MSSKYMLEQLPPPHSQRLPGHCGRSLMNDTIRLTYQTRPGGRIVGWYVEGPGMSFPLKFKTEQEAREYIRRRWNINPHVKQYGEP